MTKNSSPLSAVDRRRFLGGIGAVAGLAAAAQIPLEGGALAAPRVRGGEFPFKLGIASGCPEPGGVVLWTRLVPEPFSPDGGMPSRAVPVDWQVALDPRMRKVVKGGTVSALPELAHSVHVEVRGLQPDREYYYRFRYRGEVTEVGRTRTAPRERDVLMSMRFAFASCQDWSHGYYSAYRSMAEEDLDLVLHLGDYVYEYGVPADGGLRRTPTPDVLRQGPRDLARWRMQYALYKSDPDLQRAHARFPWLVTWDDHEVVNDYAGAEDDPISANRVAAYRAWYEHQPVGRRSLPRRNGSLTLYRRLRWGRLAQFDLLDTRQYRTAPPCGWGEAPSCDAGNDPSKGSMLGATQEKWLLDGLRRSSARWNVIATSVMMARLDHDGPSGDIIWHDAWDGYPASRRAITDTFTSARVRNPVLVAGDWHSTFVNDITSDFDRPGAPVVATEFVGTSISTNGDDEVYGPYYGPMIKWNPHIRFFDGDRRGYVTCTVNAREWRTDLRMVPTVSRADAPATTFASFAVEDRRPGAVRI
ncbi:alkaline phosphatase [Actinomadura sp. NBRC 104412]|uniref:alkaline phosphatase D family protein n=1 Tax=Actinomadura sp. NBRC 104412 TaxID=3032203 RepID=UPI0024A5B962|nr:alkaline phosphatase D family protein [Actinomadura sp. NBRC 104412]GLZ02752.1 alkaline phosphatase [Actinomadura sp. NBRC 104412]